MLWELTPLTDACKAKGLRKGDKYYYVFFLGTREDARGRGLCSAIVKYYQEIAAREKLPIWLEAATEYCLKMYLKLGFVVVGETVLGKGRARTDGTQCKGERGSRFGGWFGGLMQLQDWRHLQARMVMY
jgi:hypothetical protein